MVKLSKHVRYLVRIRDYETVQIEVGAEADHHDLGYTDNEWANLLIKNRDEQTLKLEELLVFEVERLATEELDEVAQWSEIQPNLATDYLSSARLSSARSQSARNSNKATTASHKLTRTRTRDPSPPPTPAA